MTYVTWSRIEAINVQNMPELAFQPVKVELSQGDAMLFVKFQKHHALISLLESMQAFDITNGSVEIHFDNLGRIGSIDKHQHYRL